MKSTIGWHRLGVLAALVIGMPSACGMASLSQAAWAPGAAVVAAIMLGTYGFVRGIGWVVAGFSGARES